MQIIKLGLRKRGILYKQYIGIYWRTNKYIYQILLNYCNIETCIPFCPCPDSSKNECEATIKYTMESYQSYGDILVRKYYAEKYSESIYLQIQSQHWGGECQPPMEDVPLDYFKTYKIVR